MVAADLLPKLKRHPGIALLYYGADLHFCRLRLQSVELKDRIVISEFPSVEKARAAYESPGYKEALAALGDGAERDDDGSECSSDLPHFRQ